LDPPSKGKQKYMITALEERSTWLWQADKMKSHKRNMHSSWGKLKGFFFFFFGRGGVGGSVIAFSSAKQTRKNYIPKLYSKFLGHFVVILQYIFFFGLNT
jgi:hypothetical protein